jgi:hypothetical protein
MPRRLSIFEAIRGFPKIEITGYLENMHTNDFFK